RLHRARRGDRGADAGSRRRRARGGGRAGAHPQGQAGRGGRRGQVIGVVFRFLFGRGRSSKADPDVGVRPHQAAVEAMKVIVGPGNPGREYERTRHNVGWWVVDPLADVWRFEPWKRDGEARVTTGSVGRTRVRLVKPQTYMNLSGSVLRSYLRRP